MKGHLYKKIQPEGWYVAYDIDGFTKTELPLHPNDLWVIDHIGYITGKIQEVEFEIVSYDGLLPISKGWKGYAKLIPKINLTEIPKEQLEQERNPNYKYFDIDNTSSHINKEEQKKLITEIMDEDAKNGLYNTSFQTEISDFEIDDAWQEFRTQNPNTIGGFQDQYVSFLYAIKWYREQLKKKQCKKY